MKYPNIKRFPGGASDELEAGPQTDGESCPAMDPKKPVNVRAIGD